VDIIFLGAKCATETRYGVSISRHVSACVAGSISGIASLQGAGRQIGVLVFELAVEGEPPFIFVVSQKGCQGEHLAQRETRAHRASLPDTFEHTTSMSVNCATTCGPRFRIDQFRETYRHHFLQFFYL